MLAIYSSRVSPDPPELTFNDKLVLDVKFTFFSVKVIGTKVVCSYVEIFDLWKKNIYIYFPELFFVSNKC